jgi:hypothetical protein
MSQAQAFAELRLYYMSFYNPFRPGTLIKIMKVGKEMRVTPGIK